METVGTGPPVVFVHGVGLDRRMWDGVIGRLAPRFTCIAFDLPGHGETPLPPGEVTLEIYTDALSKVVETVPQPAVVGFSMGAMVAQHFAASQPEALSRLVLLNPVHDRDSAQGAAVRRRLEIAQTEGPRALIDAAIERWFTTHADARVRPAIAAVRERLEANRAEDFIAAYRVFATADDAHAERAGLITCPTLVMTAANDHNSTPAMSHALAAAIPRARALVLDDLGHGAAIEAPVRVADEIEIFLCEGDRR